MNLIADSAPPQTQLGCGPLLRAPREAARPLRQRVFEFVRAKGHVARADITHAMGISAGSTTTLTADLLAAGFLREFERKQSGAGRGRPKIALQVVNDAAFVIGVKLSFKRHSAVIADFAGNVVAQATMTSHDQPRSTAELVEETDVLVARLLSQSGKALQDIKSIGMGIPGIVDHKSGTVVWSPMLRHRDENLSQAFTARLSPPVTLDNDANMLTLAELWFGKGRTLSDFAVVTIESGVGMGLVLGNELYRGAHGMGLELGHIKVELDGALCQCGQRGCLEAYLGHYALGREASTVLGYGVGPEETLEGLLSDLFDAAKAGHAGAETVLRRAGQFLSLGLSNVVQLFDPALIILSGERLDYAALYADEILERMHKLTLNQGRRPCKVAINSWDDFASARGASALALSVMTARLIGGEAQAA